MITEALRYSVILCSRAYGVNRTSEICYLKKDAGDWTLQDRKVSQANFDLRYLNNVAVSPEFLRDN